MFWFQHLGCWGQNTSRIQNKEFYATLCLQGTTLQSDFAMDTILIQPQLPDQAAFNHIDLGVFDVGISPHAHSDDQHYNAQVYINQCCI